MREKLEEDEIQLLLDMEEEEFLNAFVPDGMLSEDGDDTDEENALDDIISPQCSAVLNAEHVSDSEDEPDNFDEPTTSRGRGTRRGQGTRRGRGLRRGQGTARGLGRGVAAGGQNTARGRGRGRGQAKRVDPRWKFETQDFEAGDFSWKGAIPNPPPDDKTPFQYFKTFFDDEFFNLVSEQSNMYALQSAGVELNAKKEEIEKVFSILLQAGVVKMPNLRLYWSSECRYSHIADLMNRSRFFQLLKFLHFVDNTKMKKPHEEGYDVMFKIRPVLNQIKTVLNNIPPEERVAIDEQTIPFKGRHQAKQYNKSKPHKWGYKVFTLACPSGLMIGFEIYMGKNTCPDYGLGISGDIVLTLTETLPEHQNFKTFTDNWFSSLALAKALKEKGFFHLGTVRSDRMSNCPLKSEEELKRTGRGSYDSKVETNNNILLVRWYDRKAINFMTTYADVSPIGSCDRWNQAEKKHVPVPRPNTVSEYNSFMGGVDLCDMLLELYRIDIRSRKWYMRIFFWTLGVAVVNSWLLYKRHCTQKGIAIEYSLLQWQCSISAALATVDKSPISRKRGRPSPSHSNLKRVLIRDPTIDSRYDNVGHYPEMDEKQSRCRFCPNGYTKITCQKCKVSLCLTKVKNCFLSYHIH